MRLTAELVRESAYVFGRHKDEVFLQLKWLLEPFGIKRFCTDGWGAYQRYLPIEKHEVGKRKTQRVERKHLQFRTRIKRLARRTICFSKSEEMHDLVIGLFINRYEARTINLRVNNKLTTSPDSRANRKAIFNRGLVPNIPANPRCRRTPKRGRKPLFKQVLYQERFFTIERVFAWEDKFRRLLLRFEQISQLHYALKSLAYTMLNLRHFCQS